MFLIIFSVYINISNYPVLSELILVQNIIGQETGGPMYRRFIVTPRLYSCQQLQRETLGHLSAVYCLLFDHTGRYIVTVSVLYFLVVFPWFLL